MKLSEMPAQSVLVEEQLRDPVPAEWERAALARAVAVAVVRHRAEHELSQRDAARALKISQPQVARWERGDVNPSMDTLMRVAAGLGIEITIHVRPAHSAARHVTEAAQTANAVGVSANRSERTSWWPRRS